MKKRPMNRKMLEYYARMAADAYMNDPVHARATKNEKIRRRYIYHFMIERLSTSNREDIIYFDKENRGMCVWREAHNEYNMFDFLLCPNWVFLLVYLPSTIKTLSAYSHLDVKVFPENTLIISPVFVSPEHQGKGIATKLIKQGIADLVPKGYKLGLEAQNEDNVKLYEKLGFKTIKYEYFEKINMHSYYMMYQPEND